jgi:cyclic-di-AMP phosphodiesterase PgpH
MIWLRRHRSVAMTAIVAVTVLLCWGVLVIGTGDRFGRLAVGTPSPSDFDATETVTVVDQEATEERIRAAQRDVGNVYEVIPGVDSEVTDGITAVFEAARDGIGAAAVLPTTTTTVAPTVTSTTVPATTATTERRQGRQNSGTAVPRTTSTTALATAELSGTLFLDLDGNGVRDASDEPLAAVGIVVTGGDGGSQTVETDLDGTFSLSAVTVGDVVVQVNDADPDFPRLFAPSQGGTTTVITLDEGPVVLDPIGFAPATAPIADQVGSLTAVAPQLEPATLETIASLATADVVRMALNQEPWLDELERLSKERALAVLEEGLVEEDRQEVAAELVETSSAILLGGRADQAAGRAMADVAGAFLEPNRIIDLEATQALRDEAEAAVEPVDRTYQARENIVREGDTLRAVHLAAIAELGLADVTGPSYWPVLAVVAVLVIVEAFYLARFRPEIWHQVRRVALFGVLLVLGAGSARLAAIGGDATSPYIIPVAAFGLMAAILFDGRIAVLMSIAMGVFAAVAIGDPGVTTFAIVAGLAPVPFVSSISTRADLRRAVAFTSLTVGVIAAATSWLFTPGFSEAADVWGFVWRSASWAAVSSAITSLVGLSALGFLEVLFDVTTTPRLLDVTDRNHPALVLLQEKAWGTFNHSLMVGTLASAAAKAIGADNLLALAAAYYHDLGKTENSLYFIENQFGISNPHDDLKPEESVGIIRQHVFDGVRLAKTYRIPAEVSEGIVTHHGDGVMHYFYEKAKELYGADMVDIDDYRHAGRKPRSREMAILMMADSTEAACRAALQTEDPSVDGITKVVERVIGEKVDDGQLGECSLTLGDLSSVKQAFIDALVGHYHPRIPYPNFPGGELGSPRQT